LDEGRAEVATLVRGTHGDVEMEEAMLGGSGSAQDEAERAREVAPRESGIARAVIARERRPHPTEGWVEALENAAYRLETLEGGAIPRTWNATHLKLYFS